MKAGLSTVAADEMNVALGELLSNVHQHAYQGNMGLMGLAVLRSRFAVSVFVFDRGNATVAPCVPLTSPPPRHTGGRGLYLVRLLTDRTLMCVNRKTGGLTVRITKYLRPAETAA
jgi:anti-sigma regulatory factor (Ser/Thr protein kinase)